MENVIEFENVSHDYGSKRAVDNLSFMVKPGEVIGLLGPNGAGKTTTIRLANGLFTPCAGRIRVLGLDPSREGSKVRSQSGVLTETPALYERLTSLQNLEFFGTMAGMTHKETRARSEELLSFFELSERANERVAAFSKGMKQRLALARALLHNPQLLFLDEPTSGLDPEAAQQVHQLIASLRRRNGQTVILCTHHLHEAEQLCDRMAVINHGRLLSLGSLEDMQRQFSEDLVVDIKFWDNPPDLDPAAAAHSVTGVKRASYDGGQSPLIVTMTGEDIVPILVTRLVEKGASILSVQYRRVSLAEIYFKLLAKPAEEEE